MAAKTKKENAAVAETKETAKKATVKKTREVYLQWYGKEVQRGKDPHDDTSGNDSKKGRTPRY